MIKILILFTYFFVGFNYSGVSLLLFGSTIFVREMEKYYGITQLL
jgi:hypothetical protein